MRIILLGTGSSAGVPSLKCLMKNGCSVCLSTNKKNIRTNTSLYIPDYNILIDCTKHFYEQFKNLIQNGYYNFTDNNGNISNDYELSKCEDMKYSEDNKLIMDNKTIEDNNMDDKNKLPSLILTHQHADAIGGLDTLKQMIPHNNQMNLYLSKETYDYIFKNFNYYFLTNEYKHTPGCFKSHIITQKFIVNGLEIEPIEVSHGLCPTFGYKFKNCVYLSDCKSVNLDHIKGVKILIVDCNNLDEDCFGHMNFKEIIELVRECKPLKTILVGLSHLLDYNRLSEYKSIFEADDLNIEFGYDMMELDLDIL